VPGSDQQPIGKRSTTELNMPTALPAIAHRSGVNILLTGVGHPG
jgi:hypothetical protein